MLNSRHIPRFLRYLLALAAVLAMVVVLGGCRVQEKHEGEAKKVDIQTPFGDMKVDTNADVRSTGLAVYPGARQKPGRDHDSNSANVNLSTSLFGLKVIAATYVSDDAPDKVLSFYTGEMKKYGTVLQCHSGTVGDVQIGKGDGDEELSCDKKGNTDVTELKVGTKAKQRIVAVKPAGKGSEFSLVYVQTRKDEGTL